WANAFQLKAPWGSPGAIRYALSTVHNGRYVEKLTRPETERVATPGGYVGGDVRFLISDPTLTVKVEPFYGLNLGPIGKVGPIIKDSGLYLEAQLFDHYIIDYGPLYQGPSLMIPPQTAVAGSAFGLATTAVTRYAVGELTLAAAATGTAE